MAGGYLLKCLSCGEEMTELVPMQEHRMGYHNVSWEPFQRQLRFPPHPQQARVYEWAIYWLRAEELVEGKASETPGQPAPVDAPPVPTPLLQPEGDMPH